ncbi:TonB-dependent receptor [Flavobacterium sp. W21_SRS_FM6]|uniref:TonB-dependent receptor n=1 Tax=Flavobacterium sp. W21_SRS_FM6 TaxID=3240268 RepID=UPI003F8F6428
MKSTSNTFFSTRSSIKYPRSLCALAVATGLAGLPAMAQEQSAAADKKGLERIEVTARKTVESLQEVPISVTSIGGLELDEKGIAVLTEIQQFSPNTTLQNSRGTNSTLTAFIRGVGQQDPLWGYEPGVGIYIDDVYVARPQGAVIDLLDVSRIEVLRGPQGTLYGKNTIGGAIKYVTKPMSGDAEMNVQGTIGSYSQRDVKVTGQYPIIEDRLFVGFGYANLNRDGFGEYLISALDNQDMENYNKDLTAARLTLEFTPSDDVFFRLSWDKTTDDSNAKGGYRLLPSLLTNAPVPDSVFDSYTSLPTENKVELEGISLTANWDITDEFSLKYIGSRRESYSPTNIDFDNTPLDIFDVPAVYDDNNTTHEIQLNYRGDGMSMVGGVYAYDGESCGQFEAILGFLGRAAFGTPGLTREVSGCNNSKSTAAYVQGSFDLTAALSLTLGARYTNEEKEADVNNGLVFAAVYPQSGWVPGYVRPDGDLVPQVLGEDTNNDGILDAPKTKSWSRFTPRVGLEYQANPDLMFFASYSQGFKSGTFNPRATVNEPAADPEIVDSIEVGMKSDWSDNLRVNLTYFSLDHKDRQYIGVIPSDDASVLNQYLANVAATSAKGIEAEVTYVATDNLTFDIALGTFDSKIEENNAVPPLLGISNTPDYTMNFAANYVLESSVGDFVINANYYYRDDYRLFEDSDLLQEKGYGMLNMSVSWQHEEGHWYASLHGKNLTDKEYLVGGYNFVGDNGDGTYSPGLGGDNTLIGYYGDPRTVSLTLGYRF